MRHPGPGTSSTEFTYFANQGPPLENPYRDDEEEEDDESATAVSSSNMFGSYPSSSDNSTWNNSRGSLRSRSATGESVQRPTSSRQAGPRFAPGSLPQPNQIMQASRNSGAASPALRFGESYFLPMMESPISSRTSTSSGMYFPRQSGQLDGLERHTAPLPYRAASREVIGGMPMHTQSARALTSRPSFPAGSTTPSSITSQPSRHRSASSPNVDEVNRRQKTTSHPPLPDGDMSKLHYSSSMSRSANYSPHLSGGMSMMMGEQSPRSQRERSGTPSYQAAPVYGIDGSTNRLPPVNTRNITPVPYGSTFAREIAISPPLQSATSVMSGDSSLSPMSQPSQLKIKVHAPAASQMLTLVVPVTISYQTLKDRIDAKLQRSTNITLSDRGPNQVKLKYLDEDDYINIGSDEDVQTAFETWREQKTGVQGSSIGEVELFCQ